MRISHVPLRLTTGAFILNAGLGKRNLPDEAAAGIQGMASGAIPRVGDLAPSTFGKALSTGEIALGAALLAPVVSPLLAGAGLAAFSGGLLWTWWKTPGMHEEGSLRPTQQGTAVAKDVWMAGIAAALLFDGIADGTKRTAKKAKKAAARQAKAAKRALPGN